MKRRLAACLVLWILIVLGNVEPLSLRAQELEKVQEKVQAPEKERPAPKEKLITLDFNNVDLPVFVKFVSELTGKNFVIDERVKGKVTITKFFPVNSLTNLTKTGR